MINRKNEIPNKDDNSDNNGKNISNQHLSSNHTQHDKPKRKFHIMIIIIILYYTLAYLLIIHFRIILHWNYSTKIIYISQNQLDSYKFITNHTNFIINGDQIDPNQQEKINSGIYYTMSQVLLSQKYQFELLENAIYGLITGNVTVLLPSGQEKSYDFNREYGYKARARILSNNIVLFEGDIYYRAACFNPLRTAINIRSNVVFEALSLLSKDVNSNLIIIYNAYNELIEEIKAVRIGIMENANKKDLEEFSGYYHQIHQFLSKNPKLQSDSQSFITMNSTINRTDTIESAAGIYIATKRAIPAHYSFILLSKPKRGYLTGEVLVITPEGSEIQMIFKKEEGYEAKAKIIDHITESIAFEGEVYYRFSCFNLLRQAKMIKTNIIFEEIETGLVYMINEQNEAIDNLFKDIKHTLNENSLKLEQAAANMISFTHESKDSINSMSIHSLYKEICTILQGYYLLESIQLDKQTLKKISFTGKGKIRKINGVETEYRNFQEFEVFVIQSLYEPRIEYMLSAIDLCLVIREIDSTRFDYALSHIKHIAEIDNKRKQNFDINNLKFDLCQENSMTGKFISVLDLSDNTYFTHQIKQALEAKGFQVYFTINTQQFLNKISSSDIVWVLSGNNPHQHVQTLTELIIQAYTMGTSIFLWADNDPFYIEANAILTKIIGEDFKLHGNYQGDKTLYPGDIKNKGTFDTTHPVSSGFISLYEGITISYPNKIDERIKVFAMNTNNKLQPTIFYVEPKASEGILWVDTGYTKLKSKNFNNIDRYITNVCCYCIEYNRLFKY